MGDHEGNSSGFRDEAREYSCCKFVHIQPINCLLLSSMVLTNTRSVVPLTGLIVFQRSNYCLHEPKDLFFFETPAHDLKAYRGSVEQIFLICRFSISEAPSSARFGKLTCPPIDLVSLIHGTIVRHLQIKRPVCESDRETSRGVVEQVHNARIIFTAVNQTSRCDLCRTDLL